MRRVVVSKSGVLYTIIIFYAVVGIFMTLLGNIQLQDTLTYDMYDTVGDVQESVDTSQLTYWEKIVYRGAKSTQEGKAFSFLPALTIGFSNVPAFINIVIFTPLFVLALYIIVTTLGGALFDGGS